MNTDQIDQPQRLSAEEIAQALEEFRCRAAAAGLKSTRQRDLIVATFFELNQHISVQELNDVIKNDNPRIGYATVYRTLKILVENGLAQPRDFGDGITRFDPLFGKPDIHDHLICTDCRQVFEFSDEPLQKREQEIATGLGTFQVLRHKLELYVTCTDPNCENRQKND